MANVSCCSDGPANNTTTTANDDAMLELPIIVSYMILLFRIISTLYVTITGIAVIVTVIKEKDNFKGRQISLIVNLMVSGIVSAVNATLQSGIMIISYLAGVDDPIRCDILFVTLSTFHVNAFAFLILSVDKFVSIKFPLRYSSIVTDRMAYVMIFLSWAVSIVICTIRYFIGETYRKLSQYGVCNPNHDSFISLLINFIAPLVAAFLPIVVVDVYASFVAYKLQRKFHLRQQCSGHRESGLSQTTSLNSIARLGRTLDRLAGHNIKPIMGVLIGIASNCLLGLVCPVLFVTVQALNTSVAYKFYVESIVIPNAAYCFLIVYTMIYSLYFRNIRKPMCLMMKQLIRTTCSSCVRCCDLKSVTQRSRVQQIAPVSRHTAQSNAWL